MNLKQYFNFKLILSIILFFLISFIVVIKNDFEVLSIVLIIYIFLQLLYINFYLRLIKKKTNFIIIQYIFYFIKYIFTWLLLFSILEKYFYFDNYDLYIKYILIIIYIWLLIYDSYLLRKFISNIRASKISFDDINIFNLIKKTIISTIFTSIFIIWLYYLFLFFSIKYYYNKINNIGEINFIELTKEDKRYNFWGYWYYFDKDRINYCEINLIDIIWKDYLDWASYNDICFLNNLIDKWEYSYFLIYLNKVEQNFFSEGIIELYNKILEKKLSKTQIIEISNIFNKKLRNNSVKNFIKKDLTFKYKLYDYEKKHDLLNDFILKLSLKQIDDKNNLNIEQYNEYYIKLEKYYKKLYWISINNISISDILDKIEKLEKINNIIESKIKN